MADPVDALRMQLEMRSRLSQRQAGLRMADGYEDGHGPAVRDNILRGLDRASAYFWAGHMVDLVVQHALTIPRYAFTPASFPTECGFVWLEKPIRWAWSSVQAWGWASEMMITMDDDGPSEPGFMLTVYPARDQADLINMSTRYAERWDFRNPDRPASQYPQDDQPSLELVRLAAASLTLMAQQILIPAQDHGTHVSRAFRKTFEHTTGAEPILKIVELRTRVMRDRPPTGERGPVEWHHQWTVRGHQRRLGTKTVWVRPHTKGPLDKPLKPPKVTIFNVDR